MTFAKPHYYDPEKKCPKKNPKKMHIFVHFGFFLSTKFAFLREKLKKVQKSDFPRKRSHFQKKDLEFVTTEKKNPFLQNYFEDPGNGHFKMSKIDMAKIVLRKWIFWI